MVKEDREKKVGSGLIRAMCLAVMLCLMQHVEQHGAGGA
jgi:hypothetical protein